jgi:hypothetical protein
MIFKAILTPAGGKYATCPCPCCPATAEVTLDSGAGWCTTCNASFYATGPARPGDQTFCMDEPGNWEGITDAD